MLKHLSVLALACLPLALLAQKTADQGSVTFETSTTKSPVSYTGIGVEYYKPSSLYGAKDDQLNSKGFGVSYEMFSPFRPKTAVTLNSAVKYMTIGYGSDFSYNQLSVEMNLGLHQMITKGLYIKPQVGYGRLTGTYEYGGQSEEVSMYKGLYGLQTGFLFNMKSERPKFIDIGLMYQGYFSGGSYLGIAAKYLIGPKG